MFDCVGRACEAVASRAQGNGRCVYQGVIADGNNVDSGLCLERDHRRMIEFASVRNGKSIERSQLPTSIHGI
jgi:hypothetical protein